MSKLNIRQFYNLEKMGLFQFFNKKDFSHKYFSENITINKYNHSLSSNFNEKNLRGPLKVFYFGNDDISLSPLETLYSIKKNASYNLISEINVITTPRAPGNKTQVKFHNFVKEKELKCTFILNDNWNDIYENVNKSENCQKAGVVCSFGKMIPSDIITSFESNENKGIYVLHPSLLPKYRGGAPIQHTLLNNEKETGVSLITTSKNKFDAGQVLMQNKITIENYFTFKELSTILSNESAKLLGKFFIEKNLHISENEKPLLENNGSFAKLITDKKVVYLDFINQNTEEIMRIFKAFNGSQLFPFCKIKFGNHIKQTIFENLYPSNSKMSEKIFSDKLVNEYTFPGCIYWDFKIDPANIYIKSANGWLISSLIKMEGYETLTAKDFVNKAFKNQRVNKQDKKMYVGVVDKKDFNFS